jgi:hypothetical protein
MSGREPCSQTPIYDIPATTGKQATAGMLATAKIQAATGTPSLKVHKIEIFFGFDFEICIIS